MTSTASEIFRKVARRELDLRDGADQLAEQSADDLTPGRPRWMPRWVYATGIVVFAILVSPFSSSQRG
jgi:hypothetical protein